MMLSGSCEEDYEDVSRVLPVHFTLCRLSLIVLGQAEQCLLGVQVPELWGKGLLEIKLIDLEYFKNKT